MTKEIIRVKSIGELHHLLGLDQPKHPLISVIDVSNLEITEEILHVKYTTDFYYVGLKSASCGLQYGRNQYDFDEGILAFTAPNQVVTITSKAEFGQENGWMLFFHPDLIRNSPLGENIDDYTFFSYEAYEALHLSDKEKHILLTCVSKIKEEWNEATDNHSQRVMISNLELLLNYCLRFYERQFNTRATINHDIVAKVQDHLKEYYILGQLETYGPPSIHYLADKVNLSTNYFSDLLKKETGIGAKDFINEFLVDKAKNLLLGTGDSVSEIAYTLGFNYPHYFSRIFKSKTGVTPQNYRELQH